MRALATLLLFCATSVHAQFGNCVSCGRWEPRNFKSKLGLVADWDFGRPSLVTLNGAGVSRVEDRTWQPGRLENLLVQSSDFSTSWVRSGISAFGASDTGATNAGSFSNTSRTSDPIGGNTADFLQEDTSASAVHAVTGPALGTIQAGDFILEVWAKPAGRNSLRVRINGSSTIARAYFNVATGTAGSTVGSTCAAVSAAIVAGPVNGWYQCRLSATFNDALTAGYCAIYLATDTPNDTYTGNSTDGIYLWGAQLRRSTSASTYVATTTNVEDASRTLLQSTAAAQPLISRTDNSGNLLVRSEEFQTTWSRSGINAFGATDTGATNAGSFANTTRTTDPLGGNTADFVQEDTSTSHYMTQTGISIPSQTSTLTVYAKPAGRTWMVIQFYHSSGNFLGYFDIGNGIAGPMVKTGTGTTNSSSITSAGNGWYACSITGDTGQSGSHSAYIYLATTNNSVSYTGNSTSGLYLWGASLRQSSWSTNYIATTSTIAVPGLQGRATAYFDGTAHYLKANAFTLNQPETVLWLGKQVTWTASASIFDGNLLRVMQYYQNPSSPSVRLTTSNGSDFITETNRFAVDTWSASTLVFNQSASSIQIDKGTILTGNAGSGNGGGFTLGATGTAANKGNIQTARVLLSNKVLATNELEFARWGLLKYAGVK